MKRAATVFALALVAASSATMAADDNKYFSVAYNMWDISLDGYSGSIEPSGIEGRYGYHVNSNFAIEGRFGLGMQDDMGVDISRNLGIYMKGVIDASDAFQPYAFFGYSDITIDTDFGDESDNDLSYGFGANFGSGSTKFMFEWGRLYSDSGLDIDSMALGVTFTF